jgi:hypothetical protein
MIDLALPEFTPYDYSTKISARTRGISWCREHDICAQVTRQVVWGRDQGMCRIRGPQCAVFVPLERFILEHINPEGRHCYYNVQTACYNCNNWKRWRQER